MTPCRIGDCAADATYIVRLVLADEVAAGIVVCEEHAAQIKSMDWGLSVEPLATAGQDD